MQLPNARLVADSIAKQGFQVYVPDIFNGDWIPHNMLDAVLQPAPTFFQRVLQIAGLVVRIPSIIYWMWKHRQVNTLPIVSRVCEELHQPSYGIKKLAAQGYCFGGKYSILLAGAGRVDAFLAIHPSTPKPDELERIIRPGCFLLAVNDYAFPPKKVAEARALLETKTGLRFDWKEYEGVKHGFAIRGDERDPKVPT